MDQKKESSHHEQSQKQDPKQGGTFLDLPKSENSIKIPTILTKELSPQINPKEFRSAQNKEGNTVKIKHSISRIFNINKANASSSSLNDGLVHKHFQHPQERSGAKFNIMNLLPHKEALKDLKHVIHFSQFQNADSTTQVADGESFKLLKHNMISDKPSNIYLEVLDSYYDYKTLVNAYHETAEDPLSKTYFNKFFTPLDDKHLETDYSVVLN